MSIRKSNVDGRQEYVLSLSYGKDSLACLGAIAELGWPLDRIVHAEVWATDTIPAELPPMIEFKAKADAIIKARWGITVEHIRSNNTYEKMFYREYGEKAKRCGEIWGWPFSAQSKNKGNWCNALKVRPKIINGIEYIGIASDEPNRFRNLSDTKKSPLVEAGWTEEKCREWCERNDLLSPIYTVATRGGCWFCHNQGIQQLRLLRKKYPEYWGIMLKWDNDSPVTFKAPSIKGKKGHTVHDFERRFQLEDDGLISPDDRVFRWSMLDEQLNYRLF